MSAPLAVAAFLAVLFIVTVVYTSRRNRRESLSHLNREAELLEVEESVGYHGMFRESC